MQLALVSECKRLIEPKIMRFIVLDNVKQETVSTPSDETRGPWGYPVNET